MKVERLTMIIGAIMVCSAVMSGSLVSCSFLDLAQPGENPSDGAGPAYPPVLTGPNAPLPMAWTTYEAEEGFGGIPAGPDTALGTPAAEASGRRYTLLSAQGESLSWTARARANAVVVRYTVPDGETASLEVLVNGARVSALKLSSAYSWVYGPFRWDAAGTWTTDRWAEDPSGGYAHHFFDEVHGLLPVTVLPGDQVALRKADGDSSFVGIDFMELEEAAPPLTAPENSLSLAAYSPAADGVTDDTAKLAQCILDAKAQGKSVWVPAGTYRIGSLDVSSVIIRGAGMWNTRFTGKYSRFRCVGGNLGFYDFAILGETSTRNDDSGEENGFDGNPGSGSVLERVWVEHKKCAFWVGVWGNASAPQNLTIRDCRFRNLMADAVNLCSGTSDSLIEGCSIRNTGDDGLAVWSPAAGGPLARRNAIRGNLVQNPWFANGIALYGGEDLSVEGNEVRDTLTTGSGIYVSANFGARPFSGTVTVSGNILNRCGSAESDAGGAAGAIRFVAGDADMTGASFLVTDNDAADSVRQGLSIQTSTGRRLTNLKVTDLRISGSGSWGIEIKSGAQGSASFGAVSVESSVTGAYRNGASAFTVSDLGANEGWSPL